MQDGAPSHTTQANKSILKKHKVRLLDWPSNSPDLNPIENAWAIVQQRLGKHTYKTFAEYQ